MVFQKGNFEYKIYLKKMKKKLRGLKIYLSKQTQVNIIE